MNIQSRARAHGGEQIVASHRSQACGGEMTFAIYLPPQAQNGPVPVLWYLSGLTCTHQNVMDKGEYRAAAAEHGVAIVCPDTSPRGDAPDIEDDWQIGHGAGFYVDATEEPWSAHYRMERYVMDELPALVGETFPVDMKRQSVTGHSMGGHGALTLALRHPDRFRSVSAFAPIVAPMQAEWSRKAFATYLGPDEAAWADHDAVALIDAGARVVDILVDQGEADGFLQDGLKPWLLRDACDAAGIPLTLNMRPGYDHSYFFISTFMADHIGWHRERLAA